MPLRECHAGAALQVPLERYGAMLIGELNDDVDNPWSVLRRVWTPSGVVRVEPCREVRCQACVVARWIGLASENVDD